MAGNKTEVNRICKGLNSEGEGRYKYQYDALSRLTQVVRERETLRRYEYDGSGNRTKKVENAGSTSYSYNALNQLIAVQEGSDYYKYGYDRRGNLTETYKNSKLTHKYHFGALNRLETVYNYEQEKVALYEYNGLGNRIGKRIGLLEESVRPEAGYEDIIKLTLTHVEDVIDLTRPHHNLLSRTNKNLVDAQLNETNEDHTRFIYDFSVLSTQNEEESLYYLHDDIGSPTRLINENGYECDFFNYDEFGNPLTANMPKTSNPFTFTGYMADSIANTYYAQAREYRPELGRFIAQDTHWNVKNMIWGDDVYEAWEIVAPAPDSFAIRQSNNLYEYTLNNPLRFLDFDGQCIWLIPGAPKAWEAVRKPIVNAWESVSNSGVVSAVKNFFPSGNEVFNRAKNFIVNDYHNSTLAKGLVNGAIRAKNFIVNDYRNSLLVNGRLMNEMLVSLYTRGSQLFKTEAHKIAGIFESGGAAAIYALLESLDEENDFIDGIFAAINGFLSNHFGIGSHHTSDALSGPLGSVQDFIVEGVDFLIDLWNHFFGDECELEN